jgi:Leucine-rich repeat (LRR) protein
MNLKKIISAVFIWLLLLQTPVLADFKDPILEQEIIKELNAKPPTAENLSSITELYLFRKGVTDLSGIEDLKGLTRLEASGNQITDLRPLAELRNLKYLALGANQVKEVTPLSNLTQLIELELFQNQITDIQPLAGLTNLEYFYINRNNISDISIVANMTKLEVLQASHNNISDTNPVANLSNIKEVNLYGNQVQDTNRIINMLNDPELKVDLRDNPISNLSPLNIQGKLAVDADKTGGNPQVQAGYQIKVSSFLDGQIRQQVKTTEPLTIFDAQKIQELDLSGQSLDLEGIENLTQIKKLNLDNTNISDLAPIGQLQSLESLSLKNNNITSIETLTRLPMLKELYLSGNSIDDYSPLIPLTHQIIKRDYKPTSIYRVNGVINVLDNDKYLLFGEYPFIENGRVVAPARAILEYFDFVLTWDNDSKTVTAGREGLNITIPTQHKTATINNNNIELDVAGIIKEGRIYVPLRFLAEAINLKVDWDADEKTVIISQN